MTDKYDKIISKLDEMSIASRLRRCLRNHSSYCALCLDACPAEAISLVTSEDARNAPQIDSRICNLCGACATICPTGVFKVTEISDEKILLYAEMLSDYTSDIVFSCSYQVQRVGMIDSAPTIVLPCLARLNEAVLVGSACLDICNIWVNSAFCKECPNQKVSPLIEERVQVSQKMLKLYGNTTQIIRTPEQPENLKKKRPFRKSLPPLTDFEPVSRRGFFEGIRKTLVSTGIIVAESELSPFLRDTVNSAMIEYHLPQKRKSLLQSLKKMEEPPEEKIPVSDFPFFSVRIKNNCSGCESCVFFCPTRALTKTKTEGCANIEFALALCTKCDLCREVCSDDAIYYEEFFNPLFLQNEERKTLISFGRYTCEKCKSEFLSAESFKLCRYCQKKQATFEPEEP